MYLKTLNYLQIALCAILINACNQDGENPANNSGLVIQAGYICGWGSGTDSIQITKTAVRYVYYIPRKSQQPQIVKTRTVSESEWTEIINSINLEEFTKLNYNTCNVCFDGCDEWIQIHNDQTDHKITFGKGLKIDAINQLQEKLSRLRAEFNN